MTKTHVRHSLTALLLLGFASGCTVETDESASAQEPAPVGLKVAQPSQEIFEYAPEGEKFEWAKMPQESALEAKGSYSRVYGGTFVSPVTIANNQTVSYTTSNGSAGVDTVLVLFRRHDNGTGFMEFPYTTQRGLQTLAINDDIVPGSNLYSSITYKNTSGRTENAWVMVFAWANSTGTADLTGFGNVPVAAGSVKISGTAGTAWTSGSVRSDGAAGDPWLFTFDSSPGLGNGNWEDDTTQTNRESTIVGNTSLTMWYVAHGFFNGTTNINN